MRERIGVGVAWAAGLVAPAIALGHAPHGVGETASWILGCAASLILWIAVVDGLAQLRGRAPELAWPLAALVALVLPLWIVGANRYFVAMHGRLPPSAVWFGCRNPRYAYVLALEATTPRERALLVAAPLLLLALLHRATRRAPPPSPWWLPRVRAVAVAVALVLVILPRAPRPPDLEGLRATVGGVGMFLAHARPQLGRPARLRPSPLPSAVERPNVVLLVQESLGAAAWAPWNRRPDSSPRIAELLAEDAAQAEWFGDAVSAAGATAVSLPTILTGLPPDANGDEFRRAPLLWQEARALGYRTALVSAQSYDWLGFSEFFLGADAPDVARTATELGGPRVNDNGVDDARAVDEAIRFIDATPRERPFLVVVQLNATHRPCWAPGAAAEPLEGGRCALAARYVDDVALRLVDHLRARPARGDARPRHLRSRRELPRRSPGAARVVLRGRDARAAVSAAAGDIPGAPSRRARAARRGGRTARVQPRSLRDDPRRVGTLAAGGGRAAGARRRVAAAAGRRRAHAGRGLDRRHPRLPLVERRLRAVPRPLEVAVRRAPRLPPLRPRRRPGRDPRSARDGAGGRAGPLLRRHPRAPEPPPHPPRNKRTRALAPTARFCLTWHRPTRHTFRARKRPIADVAQG